MNLLLIRHGDVDYPKDNEGFDLVYDGTVPLAPHGHEQLRDLGRLFINQEVTINGIFVSPYVRAQESANALLEYVQAPQRFAVDDLRDVDPNSWIGNRLVDYAAIGGDTYSHPQRELPHESLEQVAHRMYRALAHIHEVAQHEGFHTIAAVSHGDPLSALCWMLHHDQVPEDYATMKEFFYPRKGEAVSYQINNELKATTEGQVYCVESVGRGKEWNR